MADLAVSRPDFSKATLTVLIVGLLSLDVLSKVWVRAYVPLHELSTMIPSLLDLTHVENRGVSFSLLADLSESVRVPLLVGVSALASLGMLYYLYFKLAAEEAWAQLGLALVIPGAIGNLLDRAIYGQVTDFLHFRWGEISFFVNNLADCFISFGVVALAVASWQEHRREKNDLRSGQESLS
ncbi:MAG TPA: signal peptidase II [Deltaproteobacteria bacterium]|jgi:signal peptidase II|nr:signal peptidase II [SAR324 cluster bacterium]HIF70721.1 signal peptidase II [Candidatus Lambdaproteobacteria bacterium]HIL15956.1 signal peptidase II [Deltaproteobacteria bacterium]